MIAGEADEKMTAALDHNAIAAVYMASFNELPAEVFEAIGVHSRNQKESAETGLLVEPPRRGITEQHQPALSSAERGFDTASVIQESY